MAAGYQSTESAVKAKLVPAKRGQRIKIKHLSPIQMRRTLGALEWALYLAKKEHNWATTKDYRVGILQRLHKAAAEACSNAGIN